MDTWREILREVLKQSDAQEKRRLADDIGLLSVKTLTRWAEGVSDPQNHHYVRSLERAVSLYRDEMREALREAFPEAFEMVENPAVQLVPGIDESIPSEFVWRVLRAYTTTPASLQEWTITNLVLDQMIHHLDPDAAGIAVVFAQYIPNLENAPFGLSLHNGGGSALWETRQLLSHDSIPVEHASPYLLSVAQSGAPCFFQALPDASLPELNYIVQPEAIKALAFYRIQRKGIHVAGVLLICAQQEDFFNFLRRKLVERYAELFSLAYPDQQFYPL